MTGIKPLCEGYVRKGGRNQKFQVKERPPAPAPASAKLTLSTHIQHHIENADYDYCLDLTDVQIRVLSGYLATMFRKG